VLLLTIPIGQLANSRRIDPRVLVAFGLACSGLGVIRLGFVTTPVSDFASMIEPLLLTGCGISFVFAPLLVSVLGCVKPVDSPKAGAFISLALNLGGSVASASLVTVLDQRESFHGTILRAHATISNPAVTQFISHFGIARLGALFARQSDALAYADTFFLLGVFALLLSPLAFALPRRTAQNVGNC